MSLFKHREKDYAIQRLRFLMEKHPEAAELLGFFQHVLSFQKEVYLALENSAPDWRGGIRVFYDLIELCENHGSEQIRERAQELRKMGQDSVENLIGNFLKQKTAEDTDRFFFLSFLSPYFERIAEKTSFDSQNWLKTICPVCGFKPYISLISDREEREGGRFLQCVLCGAEWVFNRNKCVNCGNEDDNALNYYFSEENKAIQLQACDKCGHYIKLIDMRLDGLAVPKVDDLASLSLDLWAKEKGLVRFERNLFGL